jgi:Flp pilus assembly protein TadG
MRRRRQRGQAIVEFGLIALLFTGLMFAVVDLGLLLNTWLTVSNGAREIGRSVSVGKHEDLLEDLARELVAGSVTTKDFVKACCDAGDAIELRATYYDGTDPDPMSDQLAANTVDDRYLNGSCPTPCTRPQPGDYVRVEVLAHGAQIITPLIRPVFGCRDGNNPRCVITLTSSTIVRFEGQDF